MTGEEIIAEILSKNSRVTKEEIAEKLEEKRHKTGGLISDEILFRMIAADFGVQIRNAQPAEHVLSLRDLVAGLGKVTVTGRVVAFFPIRTFNGSRSGKLSSLLLADKTGMLRVVFWNNGTKLVESGKIRSGEIIRVSHGYTKEDRNGKVELHVGEKGVIEISPQDVNVNDFPAISSFTSKIGSLSRAGKKVSIIGTVEEFSLPSNFQRQDASSGRVLRLIVSDETGTMPVVVWNEKVDELESAIQRKLRLLMVDAKVKRDMGQGFEIHVDGGTYVETLGQEEQFTKIADLRSSWSRVNVEGEVIARPVTREVKTSKSEIVRVATFELKDETGRIWFSAWRNKAECVNSFERGSRVRVRDACVRKGFGDQLELSTRDSTSIEVLPHKD